MTDLKKDEGNNKWFLPCTFYESFVQGNLDQGDAERKVQYARLRKNDKINIVREELTMRNVAFESTTNWTNLLTLLKENEGNLRSFLPHLPKDQFTLAP